MISATYERRSAEVAAPTPAAAGGFAARTDTRGAVVDGVVVDGVGRRRRRRPRTDTRGCGRRRGVLRRPNRHPGRGRRRRGRSSTASSSTASVVDGVVVPEPTPGGAVVVPGCFAARTDTRGAVVDGVGRGVVVPEPTPGGAVVVAGCFAARTDTRGAVVDGVGRRRRRRPRTDTRGCGRRRGVRSSSRTPGARSSRRLVVASATAARGDRAAHALERPGSSLLHELGLEHHAHPVDLAVDRVVTVHQADVLHLRADL